MNLRFRLLAFLLVALTGRVAAAEPPPIRPLRQLEDYRYLRDPRLGNGFWWEPWKTLSLSSDPAAPFLGVGGEVRVRYEWIRNTDFGSGPQDNGGYILTRYMPYLSLTVPQLPGGWSGRLFAQAEAASNDYDERGAGPIDEEGFDMLQAFAQIEGPIGDGRLSLQAGRQILSFGSERLLGSRYGPNIPLSFDGGLVAWKGGPWEVNGFYLRPVEVDPDPLNNLSDENQQIWGIYATRELKDVTTALARAKMDLYYLGYFDAAATYNSGTGCELRHTLGMRVFGDLPVGGGVLDWNHEGIVQFGSFESQRGRGDILAWSVGTETGYTFSTTFLPRLSVRANIISGDADANDANLQTFNPLFPKGKYFGELTPVGPYNLINILGGVNMTVTDTISLSLQGGPYWRYSSQDAVYGVGGNIVRGSEPGAAARFIGTQLEVVAEWKPLREVSFLVSYSYFQPGDFIRQTGPAEPIQFFAFETVFQF